MTLYVRVFESPVGPLTAIVQEDEALTQLLFGAFAEGARPPEGFYTTNQPLIWDSTRGAQVEIELAEYCAGRRQAFSVALAAEGTEFQQLVWAELRRIPYGSTISYGELARRIGRPQAARAVGRANATNPIPIIVPCHRVVGANGTLTGFAYGLAMKERLLGIEGCAPARQERLILEDQLA